MTTGTALSVTLLLSLKHFKFQHMEKFMILLTPEDDDELSMMWEANCKDVDAAEQQAKAYLAMAGTKYKSATVMSNYKSPLAWRQATARVVNNFNL